MNRKQDHVPVGDDIIAALLAHSARILGRLLAAERQKVVHIDGLGGDEAAGEIGVNGARRVPGAGPGGHGPGAGLVGPGGEKGNQAQQLVARPDEPGEAGVLQADGFQKLPPLVPGQLRHFGLDPGRNDDRTGAGLGGVLGDPGRITVSSGRGILFDVADIEHRFRGQEVKHPECPGFVFSHLKRARRPAVAQQFERPVNQLELRLGLPCPVPGIS